jgi:SAM-dependent methyltransferase
MADNDLFGEDYMYFYADDAPDASVKPDVEIILRLLDLAPGSSLLEVGCGEGRLLRALARRGYRTTGVDRSSTMIEAALTRNGEDAAADYLIADVREMPAAPRFDGAFSWYTSFGYEDDSGTLARKLRQVESATLAVRPSEQLARQFTLPGTKQRPLA